MAVASLPFQVSSRKVDTGEWAVFVDGEVDLATAPVLDKELARYRGRVVVDLRSVSFMDSSGISVLLRHKARLEGVGGQIRLLVGSGEIRRLFELTGVDEMFQIDSSLHPSDKPPADTNDA
jgi:anti-anti-sigma factor